MTPVNVTESVKKNFFRDALRFATMSQDSDKIDSVHARFGGRHNTALGACEKRCLVFSRNWASFLGSGEIQIYMPFFRCPEDRETAGRLSTLAVWLKDAIVLSNQIKDLHGLRPALWYLALPVQFRSLGVAIATLSLHCEQCIIRSYGLAQRWKVCVFPVRSGSAQLAASVRVVRPWVSSRMLFSVAACHVVYDFSRFR